MGTKGAIRRAIKLACTEASKRDDSSLLAGKTLQVQEELMDMNSPLEYVQRKGVHLSLFPG